MWPKVESDAEKHAACLLSFIIENSEKSAQLYPGLQDEWTNIAFADYFSQIQDIGSSWVFIYREVFFVSREILLVPKVYSSIPGCVLHVVNNDTGEELSTVFNKVVPHVYQPNQLGYTFVAEAVAPESTLTGTSWKMRLMGSNESLPKPANETSLNKCSQMKFKDYYIPNSKNIICRYSVQVTADVLSTIQFETSKSHVQIRLSILDHEKEVANTTGKGFIVIPVFFFLANIDEKKQTQDKQHGFQQRHKDNNEKSDSSCDQSQPPTETMGHKYVVQAEVLYKSWDFDESQLAFAHTLQEMEKNELRVNPSSEQPSNKQPKTETPKPKEKGKASRSSTKIQEPNLDLTKAHWTLRMVSDKVESLKVKKDTERKDEIRALKKAWEMKEEGRAARALQSRLRYLQQLKHQEHDKTAENTENKDSAATSSSPSNQKLSTPSCLYTPMDYTTFIRQEKDVPVLYSAEIEERQISERLEKMQSYRLVRENILERRKQQEINRKKLTERHVDMYDKMQATVRESRKNFLDACDVHSVRHVVGKEEQHENQALEDDRSAAPTSNAKKQPFKPATNAGKRK